MTNPSEDQKHFELVTQPEEIDSFFTEAHVLNAPCMIWTRDQSKVIQTHFSLHDSRNNRIEVRLPKDIAGQTFMDEMAAKKLREVFFSLSLNRANVFFTAELTLAQKKDLQFVRPEKIYKVQRRKDLRLQLSRDQLVVVEYQDPQFEKAKITRTLLDLSASGAAFLVPENEAKSYQTEMVLENLSFSINGRKIITNGEVRHIRPTQPGLCKVGVRFQSLKLVDEQWLASYVFEQNRKLFSRLASLD